MIVAILDTAHFTFVALGRNESEARDVMACGWVAHKHQVDPASEAVAEFCEFEDGVHYLELEPGQCARDSQVIATCTVVDE